MNSYTTGPPRAVLRGKFPPAGPSVLFRTQTSERVALVIQFEADHPSLLFFMLSHETSEVNGLPRWQDDGLWPIFR